MDLANKVAVVTGGSRGIGAACCRVLSACGAKVVVNYRVETPSAQLVVKRIQEAGGDAFPLDADVSRVEEAEMLVSETVDRFGSLDILVNSAGIWTGAPVEEISDREWQEMVGINLTGTFQVTRAAVPHLRESKGTIINISSTAAQRGEAGHSHYAATKGAIQSFTKSLATELGGDGVRTNCVAPGWVETDMTRETLESESREGILAQIPLGRAGTPDDIAGVVAFLASDLAAFINGEIVNVNGGSVLCG
ncbi:hypothetical protein ABI59_06095 [Acidobacteria bacterium Mor1]|nr:hypothetical protein ABI59_06095 [Acidobacteria bacterium Mor1]